eukprot:scaffold129489_cov17-Prasinocladus_malaysianus.AAC.1
MNHSQRDEKQIGMEVWARNTTLGSLAVGSHPLPAIDFLVWWTHTLSGQRMIGRVAWIPANGDIVFRGDTRESIPQALMPLPHRYYFAVHNY